MDGLPSEILEMDGIDLMEEEKEYRFAIFSINCLSKDEDTRFALW